MRPVPVKELWRGALVAAVAVPEELGVPAGTLGVVFERADAYGDGNGPMVRFINGRVCNVYDGWVRRSKGARRLATKI